MRRPAGGHRRGRRRWRERWKCPADRGAWKEEEGPRWPWPPCRGFRPRRRRPARPAARLRRRAGRCRRCCRRTWSASWSQADGTNRSDTATRQRVYEYAVEPTALQNLPEYALLVADRSGGILQLRAVECDPAIITLPGASTAPLPPPRFPRSYRHAACRHRHGEPGRADDRPAWPVPGRVGGPRGRRTAARMDTRRSAGTALVAALAALGWRGVRRLTRRR